MILKKYVPNKLLRNQRDKSVMSKEMNYFKI